MAAFTQDDFVSLLRRTTDRDGWLDPILADADGAAAMGAAIAVFARASAAVDYDCNLGLIGMASGGSPATSAITVARSASGTAGVIPTGYPFIDPRGVRVTVSTPVPVAAAALVVVLPVRTLRQTEAVNTEDDPGFSIDPSAPITLDGSAATVLIAPPGSAGIVSTTFQTVGPSTKLTGGTSDYLSLHGSERGTTRQNGESTEAYRARVRNIPDAVSPIAVADGVLAAASRIGIAAMTLEPFEDGASPALKAQHGLGSFGALFWSGGSGWGSDFFDDTGDGREIVGLREATAYLRVVLDGALFDSAREVFFFDDGYWDDPVCGYFDVDNPPKVEAVGNAIIDEVASKKAAGVSFDVYLDAGVKIQATGRSALMAETVVWAMSPSAGHAFLFSDMLVGRDSSYAAPGTIVPTTSYQRVRFTFDDASTFTTPAYTGRGTQHLTPDILLSMGSPGKPVVMVEGIVSSDGAASLNLVGVLFALDIVLP